jgi:Protein of unknown function (DUF4238)
MAGRQHHYLPRFLQRPFAHRQSGAKFYVHAHHRTRGSLVVNVANIGQERDFYGGPSDSTLDDAITAQENQLADTLRRLNMGDCVDDGESALLICALGIRTKAMRSAVATLFPIAMEALRRSVLQSKRMQNEFHRSLHDPKFRRKLIEEKLRKDFPQLGREERARAHARLSSAWKQFVAGREQQLLVELTTMADAAFHEAMLTSGAKADEAFISALSRGSPGRERAEKMVSDFEFDVWDAINDDRFVLGDCGPIAVFSDGVPRLLLGAVDTHVQMDAVLLPISPTRCVVARRSGWRHTISPLELNRASASLSHEFFISDQSDVPWIDELRQLIGSCVPIDTEDDILRVLTSD